MTNKERYKIVSLFENYVEQIIKEVNNGILNSEQKDIYIKKKSMDFNIDLNRIKKGYV